MGRDTIGASAFWAEELARSDQEVARGELVPASEVHDELLRAIAELEAGIAAEEQAAAASPWSRRSHIRR